MMVMTQLYSVNIFQTELACNSIQEQIDFMELANAPGIDEGHLSLTLECFEGFHLGSKIFNLMPQLGVLFFHCNEAVVEIDNSFFTQILHDRSGRSERSGNSWSSSWVNNFGQVHWDWANKIFVEGNWLRMHVTDFDLFRVFTCFKSLRHLYVLNS